MNETLERLNKKWKTKDTVKHCLVGFGLTALLGPWGLGMSVCYLIGDCAGKVKDFDEEDMVEFYLKNPRIFDHLIPRHKVKELERLVQARKGGK